jgi:hypothetical protein
VTALGVEARPGAPDIGGEPIAHFGEPRGTPATPGSAVATDGLAETGERFAAPAEEAPSETEAAGPKVLPAADPVTAAESAADVTQLVAVQPERVPADDDET